MLAQKFLCLAHAEERISGEQQFPSRSIPIKVRRQSVAARGVLLEPDNVFIVRRDVVVPVPVQILGRIVGPWVEPAVAFHVPVTKRNV